MFLLLMLLVLNKIGWVRWVGFVMTKSRYIVLMLMFMLMFSFMRLRTIYYLYVCYVMYQFPKINLDTRTQNNQRQKCKHEYV